MKTVAILEGWAGGPQLTKKFRQALVDNGFGLTKNLKDADVIFAHSIGCCLIPQNNQAGLIVFIDPPYWPGRSIAGRWVDLMKTDHSLLKSPAGAGSFVSKKLWEGYYILAKPSFTWGVIVNQNDLGFIKKHKDTKMILVRNKADVFCSADIKDQLSEYKNVRYIELSGNHDDYYTNPQPYIDLLLKEL